MSFFKALKKLGSATIGTALLPVDTVVDALTLGGAITDSRSKVVRRGGKIYEDLSEALEETFEDD